MPALVIVIEFRSLLNRPLGPRAIMVQEGVSVTDGSTDETALLGRLVRLIEEISGRSLGRPLPFDRQLSELGVNSIQMVNLMLAVEVEFEVAIPQADITPEHFRSLASIAALVARLRAEVAAHAPAPIPPPTGR